MSAEHGEVDRPYRVVRGKDGLLVPELRRVARETNRLEDGEIVASGAVEQKRSAGGEPAQDLDTGKRRVGDRARVAALDSIGDATELLLGRSVHAHGLQRRQAEELHADERDAPATGSRFDRSRSDRTRSRPVSRP